LIGTSVQALEADRRLRVAAVRRLGMSILPTADLVVQEGDLLYLMAPNDRVAALQTEWADPNESKGTS
jgi:trk system potassium uptake protein TrkA